MTNKAAFQLERYFFNKVSIEVENKSKEIDVDFNPTGVFYKEDSIFELKFSFLAFGEKGIDNPFVKIECIGFFKFDNVHSIEEIPSFFYRNAIALLFPYLRAFVSTVTLQANIPPMVLPTFNLSDLERPLQENTITQ